MNSVNFKKLCRVCLRESDFVTPMFGTVFKSDIPDKLAYCTGLKIKSGDGKPCLICQSCIDNLHISYAFIKTCLKSDRRFFRHFYGINEVTVKVERINVDVKPKKIEIEVPSIKTEVDNEIQIIKIDDSDDDNDVHQDSNDHINYDDIQNENDEYDSKFDINIEKSTSKPSEGVRKDDDDDFYWPADEYLMSVLTSEQVTNAKRPRRKETKQRKKYKQRIGKDGKPKISRAQLQRERTKKLPTRIYPDHDDFVKRKKTFPKVHKNRYCECCDLRFPSQEERDKHAHEVHGGVTSTAICEVCGKIYDRNYIDEHRRAHFPPQYSCKEPGCAFKTTRSSHMTKHMQTHAGADRPTFPCAQCPRVFNWRSSLSTHVRACHSQRRPMFACSFCGKTFVFKQKFVRHERIHTNEKPFACEYCPSKFQRRDVLRTHLLNNHGVVLPPVKGGPRMHRVVDIDKLKDAGKLVDLDKTNDSGDQTNDNSVRTYDYRDETYANMDKTNENMDKTNDRSGDSSGFTIDNIMQQ